MKKLAILTLAGCILIIGCASNSSKLSNNYSTATIPEPTEPNFYFNISDEFTYGGGHSKSTLPDLGMKRADLISKAKIINHLKSFIKSFIQNYFAEIGVGSKVEIATLITDSLASLSATELQAEFKIE